MLCCLHGQHVWSQRNFQHLAPNYLREAESWFPCHSSGRASPAMLTCQVNMLPSAVVTRQSAQYLATSNSQYDNTHRCTYIHIYIQYVYIYIYTYYIYTIYIDILHIYIYNYIYTPFIYIYIHKHHSYKYVYLYTL